MVLPKHQHSVRYVVLKPAELPDELHEQAANVAQMVNRGDIEQLAMDVKFQGFRNPIYAVTQDEGLKIPYGHQRSLVSIIHNIAVPALVYDRHGRFPDAEAINTIKDVWSKFKDRPRKLAFRNGFIEFSECPWPGGAGKASRW